MPLRAVDFNTLPQATRERFIQCTRGQQMPQPILADRLGTAGAIVGWGLLFVCAAGGLLLFVVASFGKPDDLGLQGPGFIALYASLAFLAVYSILAIIRRSVLVRSLPFTPGRYVFPTDFVDATSNVLKITSMGSMVDFRGVHHHTNGVYTNTIFTFRFDDGSSQSMAIAGKQTAEIALQSLRSQRAALGAAVEAGDVEKLFGFDVFYEARMANWQPLPFEATRSAAGAANAFAGPPVGSIAEPLPVLLQRAALIALGASLVIGPPLWFVREMASDAAAYSSLEKYGSKYEIERYADHGGRRAKEAREELLPRSRLREVKESATPSVTAFRAVAKEFPNHAVAKEARAEIAKLYANNLSEFHAQAAADPKMVATMDKLFAYLQAHDTSKVVVRFGPPEATDLAKADAWLAKKAGPKAVPISGHFTAASSEPREKAIVESLQGAFRLIFPADVFELKMGPRLGQPFAEPSPSIEIDYDVRPSGEVYESQTSKKSFVGISVDFNVAMKVPGDADAFTFKMTVEPPEHFSVSYDPQYGVYSGPGDGTVYHVMATNAFKQLATKMRGVFFSVGSKAFRGAAATPDAGSGASSDAEPSE